MPRDAPCHTMKCCIIEDVKLFPTVYHRIYCRKFLTLTNHIRINFNVVWGQLGVC